VVPVIVEDGGDAVAVPVAVDEPDPFTGDPSQASGCHPGEADSIDDKDAAVGRLNDLDDVAFRGQISPMVGPVARINHSHVNSASPNANATRNITFSRPRPRIGAIRRTAKRCADRSGFSARFATECVQSATLDLAPGSYYAHCAETMRLLRNALTSLLRTCPMSAKALL